MEWPTPKNVSKLRSFMGLVGYYQRFVKGIPNSAHPITSLHKQRVNFVWSPKCEDNFQRFK